MEVFKMDNKDGNDDSSSDYEPEYEPEEFRIIHEPSETNIHLEALTVIPPPIEYMSEIHTRKVEISGRQVWCGSLSLAYFFCQKKVQDPQLFRNKRILELGSGTGILGMVASKILGEPSCVALTDGDELAVNLLEQNLQNPTNKMDTAIVRAKLLQWGSDDGNATMNRFSEWCRSSWLDCWSPINANEGDNLQKTGIPQFDYIIAGDVLYKEMLPTLFFQTVTAFLQKDGALWLCHVPRSTVTQQVVVEAAESAGFHAESLPLPDCEMPGCPMEDRERARIYRVTKSQ